MINNGRIGFCKGWEMKFVIIVHHDGLYPQKFNFGELLRVAGISISHDMIEKKIQGHFRRSGCKLNMCLQNLGINLDRFTS